MAFIVLTRRSLGTLAAFRQAEAKEMKSPKRLLFGLATFLIGVLAAAVWSNYLGRRVWSPRVGGNVERPSLAKIDCGVTFSNLAIEPVIVSVMS